MLFKFFDIYETLEIILNNEHYRGIDGVFKDNLAPFTSKSLKDVV